MDSHCSLSPKVSGGGRNDKPGRAKGRKAVGDEIAHDAHHGTGCGAVPVIRYHRHAWPGRCAGGAVPSGFTPCHIMRIGSTSNTPLERLEEKNPIRCRNSNADILGCSSRSLTHTPKTRLKIFLKLQYLIMEKMIEGTKGSPAGWIASMHIFAFGLLADIMTSTTSPAFSGTIPCDMMTSFAMLSAS